jgi:hypothetical protein
MDVIEQQADLDPAIRRFDQLICEEPSCLIVMPDIGLNIQASSGDSRTLRSYRERLGAFAHQPKRGLAGVPRLERSYDLIKMDLIPDGDSAMRRQGRSGWQLGASHQGRTYKSDEPEPSSDVGSRKYLHR